jgi:hypothetical protein
MIATESNGLLAISGAKPLLQAKGMQTCVHTNGVSDLSLAEWSIPGCTGRLRSPYRTNLCCLDLDAQGKVIKIVLNERSGWAKRSLNDLKALLRPLHVLVILGNT